MTDKLYLDDPYLREFEAAVLGSSDGWCTLSRTAFYPGGGGQPPDRGELRLRDGVAQVSAVREDEAGCVWHCLGRDLPAGEAVRGALDWPYRHALMRHHGLLHIVNTVARAELDGVITGAQIGPDRSRIDFKLPSFSREQVPELERRVNEVITSDLPLTSQVIGEEEFRRRPELVRTLNVLPPVVDGAVRIVMIAGFDAQACGGTHVHRTGEIGRARVAKLDNKGRDNRRFYWELVG